MEQMTVNITKYKEQIRHNKDEQSASVSFTPLLKLL